MLSINLDDVMQVLTNVRSYLIAFGVVLALAIIVMVAVRKLPKAKKKMIRAQSGLAILLALTIVINLICTGPMSTMLDLVSGSGTINEETSAKATQLVNEITAEGVVLAKDEDNVLPVASGSKLNVFGWSSTNPCYGGTGSGALNTAYPVTDLLTGLHDAGIETNEELSKFYTDYKADRPSVGMVEQDWTLPEPNVNLYTDEMMENAKAFSDTAMVVITRVGGEGADLPTDMASVVDGSWIRRVAQAYGSERGTAYYNGTYDDSLNEGNDWDKGDHFLQLSNREEDLLDLVTSNFDNVILVYNGANAFQMDFLKDYPQIKGVLLCPGTGQSGFEGFGKVVSGEVNPSGRTADTYVSDLTAAPWWNNFGDFKYTNTEDLNSDASFFDPEGATPSFVNYVEGIYVGYKFYETAADEGLINYDDEVVFPFGYGLSYTSFTKEMSSITSDGTNLNFTVTVTNTGSAAGKDVVEIYSNPPYTNGGIEKASANLLDFERPMSWLPASLRPWSSPSRWRIWLPMITRPTAAMCWKLATISSAPTTIPTMWLIPRPTPLHPTSFTTSPTSAAATLWLRPTSSISQKARSPICPVPTASQTMPRLPLLPQTMRCPMRTRLCSTTRTATPSLAMRLTTTQMLRTSPPAQRTA